MKINNNKDLFLIIIKLNNNNDKDINNIESKYK